MIATLRKRVWLCALTIGAALMTIDTIATGAGPAIDIEVDARDLPRKLLHARMRIPCQPGKLALWYPKWVPGTHAPAGPIQDVAGLRLETDAGKTLPWRRDDIELCRVECDVPDGVRSIIARLDLICHQPAVSAAGYLSYGNASLGLINWSTCLLYPEGPTSDETLMHLSLVLPPRWLYATALQAESALDGNGNVRFKPVSLTELADCPMIAGEHLRTIPLATGPYPPAYLDLVSESPAAVELDHRVVDLYGRVVREAGALFGACHYPEFRILVTCSDDLGYLGLEHLTSSINGVHEHDLSDDSRRKGWVANLLPHEYVHSWCGKFRRPAGMVTPNFHTPEKTRLLWVYEGLAEHLGEVLMVRSGLMSRDEYRQMLAYSMGNLSRQKGRQWRSVEDTAVASQLLRRGSPHWSELRRSQDYYFEGALFWLEADAIIRERTKGKHTLDDFCQRFMGPNSTSATVVPYDQADVVKILHELADFDWESLIKSRILEPQDALPLDVATRCGYKVQYATKPSPYQARQDRDGVSAGDSLGLAFSGVGNITNVVPGMVGDRAGLAPGMKVIGVNNKTFSRSRLLDALADSVRRHKVELLLVEGDEFRTVVLDYADGPRYLEIVRDASKPDLLAEILKSRVSP